MWTGHRNAKKPRAGHRRAISSPRYKAVTKLRRRESHIEGHSWEDLDNPLGSQPEQYQLERTVLPLFYLLPQLPIGHIHPEHKGSFAIFHPSQPLLWTQANRKWRAGLGGWTDASGLPGNQHMEEAPMPGFFPGPFNLRWEGKSTNFPTLLLLHSGHFFPIIKRQELGNRHFP